jgi:thiamine-monophosphate kinase
MVSITALGSVPHDGMVRRSGAAVGDRVVVTGTIGDAALGLKLRGDADAAGRWKLDAKMRDHLADRYLLPQPRNALAETLRAQASAAIDVSDGLAGDLAKLCGASGVSAEIELARVPLSAAARAALSAEPALMETLLTGGDDYEIVCTHADADGSMFRAGAAAAGVAVTEIGRVVAGDRAPRFIDANGDLKTFARASFSHF